MEIVRSDLVTGMVIIFANGLIGHVLLGTKNGDIVCGIKGDADLWFPLNEQGSYLSSWGGSRRVKEVLNPSTNEDFLKGVGKIVWKNEPIPELTIEEAIAEIGYEFKIKKG